MGQNKTLNITSENTELQPPKPSWNNGSLNSIQKNYTMQGGTK